MKYQATAKYIRTGTRKVRLVADSIRGMKVADAVAKLSISTKHAAEPVMKVLLSAVSNAKNKNAAVDTLVISEIDVMGGPALKRWHAASKGMAHPYKKRMSHMKVVLEDKEKETT